MAALRLLQVVMASSKRLPRSLPSTPTKSPVRRYPSVSGINQSPSPSLKKNLTQGKKIKSQSYAGLVSSFRKISITPSPHPPARSKSTLPRKIKSGRIRGLSTTPVSSIEDVVYLIREEKCKNIIVMAGAGISTPSGIPDFRTPGTGLYDNLQEYNIPEPTAIFDIEYFWYDPRPFFCLAKTLYPGNYQPNYVHYFVKLLHDKGFLLRMYTQNIDGLERLAGLPAEKLVEAHGTFSTASCISCHHSYDGEQIRKTIENGDIPRCETIKCKGVIKPDVVFFGEDLPKRFYSFEIDFRKCDLLLVMGTSLEVEPFAGIVNEVSRSTPRVLINRESVGPFLHPWRRRPKDVVLKGDIVSSVKRLAKLLEWTDSMDNIIETADKEWEGKKSAKKPSDASDALAKDIAKTTCNRPVTPSDSSTSSKTTDRNNSRSLHTMVGSPSRSRDQLFGKPEALFTRKNGNGDRRCHLNNRNQNGSTQETNPLCNGNFSQTNNNRFLSAVRDLPSSRMPLLPFRYTHRSNSEAPQGNYKSIDMSKDLASAGIGLSRVCSGKDRGSVRCFLSQGSDSDDESSGSDG